ncbi:MAG TPA: ATP synthase F1 subunit epsilon [Candidatus Acidoferrum sp.]|jgi:F-type H+-transporting ATPase subunit epsilon|nr:ATP synthase F1 subunit epsilon [Candidatus Acidoferrum sp.]
MANTVPFKLITPTKVIFDGDAELVIAVTTEGEEGILPQHAPFLAVLKPGVLRANVVTEGKAERLDLATREGFMQALPDRVTVLVDEALRFADVDVAKAREELANATDQATIDFANAKLRLTGH